MPKSGLIERINVVLLHGEPLWRAFILLLPDINTRRIRRTTYKNGKKHPTSPLISGDVAVQSERG